MASVHRTTSGIAACKSKSDLFDIAGSGRAPLNVRVEAATICARCPFTERCAFRIAMPALSTRARARSRARNRAA
ncbi:hypothetical protein [Streptomyces decoyicus]|uniref:hypothetical protein n=1 Tax=Streptomyces decoyicus TaxID=249567 RepID=UPI00381F2711